MDPNAIDDLWIAIKDLRERTGTTPSYRGASPIVVTPSDNEHNAVPTPGTGLSIDRFRPGTTNANGQRLYRTQMINQPPTI